MNARNSCEIGVDGGSCSREATVRRRLGAAARSAFFGFSFSATAPHHLSRSKTPPNFALELTRGPFAGTRKSNCMASRRPHVAPSEALVSRGGRRAAVRPALGARAQLRVER